MSERKDVNHSLNPLTAIEAADLVEQLEEKWGVKAASGGGIDPAMLAAMGAGADGAALEEQTEFHRPSEAQFEQLADSDPERLFQWVRSGRLTPGFLTHAAEACGRVSTLYYDAALEVLLDLLDHHASLVREGVICGLQRLGPSEIIKKALIQRSLPEHEKSEGVRAAAQDALNDLFEP